MGRLWGASPGPAAPRREGRGNERPGAFESFGRLVRRPSNPPEDASVAG